MKKRLAIWGIVAALAVGLVVPPALTYRAASRRARVGHAGDLRDPRAVLAAGVEAVVEVADSEQSAALPRDLVRCRFPLSDGGPNPPWLLRLASESVAALLRAGVPTLVCCSGGLRRS